MIRPICALVAAGLLLGACGDDQKGSGGGGCGAGCAAGEVCRNDECRASCSRELPCDDGSVCRQGACFPIVCGDGEEDGEEECDNGDRNADDASCTNECVVAECGDSLIWDGREECDEGSDNDNDGACTERCTQARCGDGLVWKGEEECDDGLRNADDGACTSECREARCGDGLVWEGQEECDDGNETLDDACPDGPGGSCRWNVPPEAPTNLAWQQGSHTNNPTPVATWTRSASTSGTSQEFQLYADEDCTEPTGTSVRLPSPSTASLAVSVPGEGSYSFRVTVRDDEQREAVSACSSPLVVDTTPPEPASELGFAEASPHEGLTVHGTWSASPSSDVGGQSIQLYGGGACGSTLGQPIDVGSSTLEEHAIVTPTAATYSFKVISRDLAGNTATSACSPAIETQGRAPYPAKFSGELPQAVVQVRVDPKNASVLYASLLNGEIRKSVNGGVSWTTQCVSTNIAAYGGSYGRIRVSPDGTAYAAGHTQFVRVEALAGDECPVIISNSAAWASYYHSNRLAIDSTGKLYTWTFNDPAGLVSSTNKGASYVAINTTPSLINSMEVDPFDDAHLLAVFSQHSTSPVGILHSTDSGKSWTQTDAVFTSYQGGIRFNPAVEGWIYLEGGHYSKDGGATWATNASFDCSEIDGTGAGYRLASSAGNTTLQRAPNMTSPVWSNLHTFPGIAANLGVSMVSVVGSTIAVVLEGNLYVSTNAGSSFAPVQLLVEDGTLVASSIVAHGATVYAAAGGRLFKSSDGASSWSQVYAPTTPLQGDTELHLNPAAPAQLVARPESWNSTYERRVDVTLDGGASFSRPEDCCYGWAGALALGATDASRVLYFGYEPRSSTNGGLTFTAANGSGQLVWDPWPGAFVNPSDTGRAWYGESGRLYEYAAQSGNATNITSRLPFSDPAGMDLVKVASTWQLRVVSRTGQVAISQNGGASFTLVSGSGGLPSAERRIFVSRADTPSLIATAELLGANVAYSPTLGAGWVSETLDSCSIRGLALTDGELLIPCDADPAMAIATP